MIHNMILPTYEDISPEEINLAIDTDFTTPFDHLAGRKGTTTAGKTLMQQNKIYHVVCDVEFNITEVGEKTDAMLLGGYGQWRNGAAFGRFDVAEVGTYHKQVDYTGKYYDKDPNSWCRIDCGGMKGTVRLYNILITEVVK